MFNEEIKKIVAQHQTQKFLESDEAAEALVVTQLHSDKQISMIAVTDPDTMITDVSVFINGNWSAQGGEDHVSH